MHMALRNLASETGERMGRLAHRALLAEVMLTPKPGLVDRRNNGAHDDMDLNTFVASAGAIASWFPLFFARGVEQSRQAPAEGLAQLRRDGLDCEQAMFAATGGVNTHKGSIFAFGLLCAAAGRLFGQDAPICRDVICAEVAAICDGILADLEGVVTPSTAGERLFLHHGLTGARGEAASGFATIRRHALPIFDATLTRTGSEQSALLTAFLRLLAVNPDTNLVARGGLAGLAYVQKRARTLLDEGGVDAPDFLARVQALDDDLIDRRLSPGGSADLLAVTWFLAQLS